MQPPSISVVVITYNFGEYLAECIESILAQTLPPTEIVIADDCSTDSSWELISAYGRREPRIRAFRHRRNMGVHYNGTFGAAQYRGEYISIIDGDDRWHPRKLEREYEVLVREKAQVAYSNVRVIDEEGRVTRRWHRDAAGPPPGGDIFVETFSRRIFSETRSIFRNELVSREAFDREGHCDENLESLWDYDRKIRFARRYRISPTGEDLVDYRIHGGGFHLAGGGVHLRALVEIYGKYSSLIDGLSPLERARIRCNVEAHISDMQGRLPEEERIPGYADPDVYERNRDCLRLLRKEGPQYWGEVEEKFYSLLQDERIGLLRRLGDGALLFRRRPKVRDLLGRGG